MVREHNALGNAGCAGGKDQCAHHVRIDHGIQIRAVSPHDASLTGIDHALQFGKAVARDGGIQCRDLLRALLPVDHQRRLRHRRNVCQLLGGNLLVNRHHHAHAADNRHIAHDPSVTVASCDDDPFPAESACEQLCSQRVDIGTVLTIGFRMPRPVLLFMKSRSCGKPLRACRKHFLQGSVGRNLVIPIFCHGKSTFPVLKTVYQGILYHNQR